MNNSLILEKCLLFIKQFFLFCTLILSGCISSPPKNSDDICAVFQEKDHWYEHSKASFHKWGVPIHVQMAIMHQESHFVADAEPDRPVVLGFIPWFRSSSAYGYAQAQNSTWQWYIDKTGNHGADRDDFSDATDFIGWYCSVSYTQLGISKWDIKNQYFAYHEGHGGYKRRSFLKKPWLNKVAVKVERRAQKFNQQLSNCEQELENKSWFFW